VEATCCLTKTGFSQAVSSEGRVPGTDLPSQWQKMSTRAEAERAAESKVNPFPHT